MKPPANLSLVQSEETEGSASAVATTAAGGALTALEAIVLVQVAKGDDGVTAYEVMKVLGRSPMGAVSASPGAVYPAVKRARDRGLLADGSVTARRRERQELSMTEAGKAALATWAKSISPDDVLPHEPLLSKVAAFGMLRKADRIKTLFKARAAIDSKLDAVETALADDADVNARPALQGAKILLRARRSWVEALLVDTAEE